MDFSFPTPGSPERDVERCREHIVTKCIEVHSTANPWPNISVVLRLSQFELALPGRNQNLQKQQIKHQSECDPRSL